MCDWIRARRLANGSTTSVADGTKVDFCRCIADCSLFGSSCQFWEHLNSLLSRGNDLSGPSMHHGRRKSPKGVGASWIMIGVLLTGNTCYVFFLSVLIVNDGDCRQITAIMDLAQPCRRRRVRNEQEMIIVSTVYQVYAQLGHKYYTMP